MSPPLQASGAPVLRVTGVGKEYRLYASPRDRLKALVTGRRYHRSHWALREVSFELRRGQCLGVIGDNGAGKSSLLKLLAGTVQPSTGRIERIGRVTAILELGAGFHPDFTGRDNLYFAGSLIGIGQADMQRLEPEIAEFAELGDAIHRPVKTYSSGMVVRLAFALVTAVQPDVLIIDEALAVGDQHFQKKCIERITAFRKAGCTILFCSHSPYHIRHLCDVALWLDGGRVREIGPTEPVLGAYEMHTRLRNAQDGLDIADPMPGADGESGGAKAAEPIPLPPREEGAACIVSLTVAGLGEGDPPLLQSRDLVATITVRGRADERPNIGFMIEQSKGVGITSLATHEEGVTPISMGDGLWRSVLTFPDLPLHSGEYVVSAFLFDESGLIVYDQWLYYMHFRFVSPTLMPGLVRLPHRWS
uniref:ABC transporter ATP-binding protein n=1 Tax=Xylophilus sp. ASV27 TaxID=2795129 RepID=UPI00351C2DBB